eukprot:765089-Hanusia_phi.AAC.1
MSMFEIYNEKIKDLLSGGSEQEDMRVGADRHGNVQVEGLREHVVEGLQKGIGLLELGMSVRATGATNLNEHSSRSHLLIRLAVTGQDKRTGERSSGKMYLVDLAGSENVSLSGAEGKALKEAIGINRSLAALHDVMLSLSSKDSSFSFSFSFSSSSSSSPSFPSSSSSSSSSSSYHSLSLSRSPAAAAAAAPPSPHLYVVQPNRSSPCPLIYLAGSTHPLPQLAAHSSPVRLARRAGERRRGREERE